MHKAYPLRVTSDASVFVYGGPYRHFPQWRGRDSFGVKLAREIDLRCDVSVPIQDFSVPEIGDLNVGLYETILALRSGQKVYAGCMGGKGRTGLFLACLAKTMGQEAPVEHVRRCYNPHAVETQEQYEFVQGYEPSMGVMAQVLLLKAKAWVRGYRGTVHRI